MRRVHCLSAFLPGAVALLFAAACGNTQQTGMDLAPGTPCVSPYAARGEISCLANPELPRCHLCVDIVDAGPLCEFACGLDASQCPPGQTCVAAGGYSSAGCITASDFSIGYCR